MPHLGAAAACGTSTRAERFLTGHGLAGEMLAGEYGLGYLIWNSFMLVQYPVIIIAMITLGVIGSLSSLLIRMIGNRLMQWKVREEVR